MLLGDVQETGRGMGRSGEILLLERLTSSIAVLPICRLKARAQLRK
jgi:hypothetical protein